MKSSLIWLFAVPSLLTAAATEPPAPSAGPPLKVEMPDTKLFDQSDLPKGAILRIGSSQAPRSLERSFTFSPDGQYIAAGTVSRHVRIWEVATGKVVQAFGPFEPSGLSSQMIAKSVYSNDGKMLAVAAGKVGHIFDLTTGRELGKLEGHTHIIEDIAFSKDGKRLVTASYDQTAALWNRESFKRLHSFPGFASAVFVAAISEDGSTVAAADYKGIVKLWKASDGSPLRDLAGLKSMTHFLRFSADGKTLLAAGHEDGLVAWDVANGEVKRRVAEMKGVTTLSVDGLELAAVKEYSSTEPVLIWDVQTGKPIGKAAGNYGGTMALGLAPDNSTLATYGGDGILRRWSVKTGEEINRPDGHQDRITGATFTRDGKTIISCSEDGTVRFWEASTGKETRRLNGEKEHIHTLALSPDGKTLALVGGGMPVRFRWQLDETRQSSSLRLVDLETGKETRGFHIGGQTTGWARFSPDGPEIFALGHTGARFIDTATGKERNLPIKVEQGMPAGDISLDSRYAAISTNVPALRQIGKVAYIDLGENKEVFSKTFYLGGYSGLAFTPDGKHLAVAGSRDFRQKDEKITPLQLWEVPTDKVVRNFEIGDGYSRMLTFSRDGRMLAAVQNAWIFIFEVATGERRFTFTGHEGNVGAVAFSRDGRKLVSGGDDCRVLVWDLTGVQGQPPNKLEPKELDRLWNDLAKAHAAEAVAALGQMSARPSESVPYLRLRLTVLAEAEIKRIEALVADLDNDQFRVRDKAAKDLERLGEAAAPVLKRALASRSTEVRQTAERLLKKIGDGEDPASSLEARRMVRAIETLERIGDADAQALLKDLRRRGGKLIQHREADAALKRLESN
jgi:WD40 repeat protein